MNADQMKQRTKEFAKRIINLCRSMRGTEERRLVRTQIFRSGTSVGANYRAACRGRSRAEFIAKLGIVVEETDETMYWLEIVGETNIVREQLLMPLRDECRELLAIFVASMNTARRRREGS